MLAKAFELEKDARSARVEAKRPAEERLTKVQAHLGGLVQDGARLRAVHDDQGKARMPPDTLDRLGLSLFSDYLLAVELAGLLLMVAAVGAIVLAGRRTEVTR